MDSPRERIGKYTLFESVGSGSMGRVYRGHDPFSDREVAVKVCTVATDETHEGRLNRKLFFNEAHTAGSLNHPNIVKILDAGEEDGLSYLVMEYVTDGESLKPFCAVDRLLPIRRVAEIWHDCCWALDYMHQRGVIHRDIKPSNILLAPDRQVKLGDFGIAQRSTSDTTQVNCVIGTPRYMSPEQLEQRELTAQTDIYSLGTVMFELLTGKPAFDGPDLSTLIGQIINTGPPPVCALRAEVPEGLAAVLRRAMAGQTDRRYATGREMAHDLSEVFAFLDAPKRDLDAEEKFARVSALNFFSEFAASERWEVIRAGRWESYRHGDRIIVEGTLGMSFHVIVHGEVTVTKSENSLCTLRAGDCFGEMAYLSSERRTASIIASGDVNLLTLDATIVGRTSVGCRLKFNESFVRTLIRRLAVTSEALLDAEPAPGEAEPPEQDPTPSPAPADADTVVLPRRLVAR